MNRVSKKTIAASKPFMFIVGPDQTEYTIHSALVQHQSPALAALVNSGFKESTELSVKWDDVDETTFSSFWQFVYADDYDTPLSDTADPDSDPAEDTDISCDDADSDRKVWRMKQMAEMRKWKWKGISKYELFSLEFERAWNFRKDDLKVDDALRERSNSLVHHARVFVLADRYGIERLMDLSLGKLHDELRVVDLTEKNTKSVLELLRYAFYNPVSEALRKMVTCYAVCVVEQLWEEEEFQDLVEDNGALSKALVGTLLRRLD
ncbi:hypothetical protein NW762_011510 [Fusarium torreyae]|uniref:BTB domain-containing protein n=1 Tax=Fusarium torreyae TaxID=1237075 RepID=A0A9W8RSL0_9HYPO|nr:hypothetical protein NW762_011510 [Fusarium torreyae]